VPDLVVRGGPRYNRELLELGPGGNRPVGWEGAVEIGITIPLFNRNQGNVRAAQAELGRAQAELRRLELSLGARLADVFDEYLTSLRSAEVFRSDIVPRADQAYQLHLARFREMAASYPQVLVAQRTLVQVNEDYLGKLDAAWRAAIQLQGFLLGDGLAAAGRPGEAASEMPGVRVETGEVGGVRSARIQR
jgi:cobalt-zinc-cadmium efflux system outer membrane protein